MKSTISLGFLLFSAAASAAHGAPHCEVANWNDYAHEVQIANFAVKLAEDWQIVKKISSALTPLELTDVSIPDETVKLLGSEYTFKSTFSKLNIKGVKTIDISPVNITSSTSLQLGGSVNDLDADVVLDVNIEKKSFELFGREGCSSLNPTKWFKPCEPKTVSLNIKIKLTDASVSADTSVEIMKCGGNWFDKLLCRTESSWEFLKGLCVNNLGDQFLKRVKSVQVKALDVKWGNIENLGIDVVNSNKFEEQLVDHAVAIGTKLSNKSGFIHKVAEKFAGIVSKKIANDEIALFQSKFQSDCTR